MKSPFTIEPSEFESELEANLFSDEFELFSDEFEFEMPPLNLANPEFIRWVQASLNQLIRTGLAVDGVLGPITRAAVRLFQQQQGLTVDGIVGPQTAGRIQELLSGILPLPRPTPIPTPTPTATADRWVLPNDIRAAGETQMVRYDNAGSWVGPSGCAREHTPGAKELGHYIQTNFPKVSKIDWVVVCRPNTANASATSMHGVGRALDIYVPMHGGRANSAVGDPIANWLIQNASSIGIQFIIWNRTQWNGSKPAPKHGNYGGPNPHIDHIHAELNRDGAQRLTPWFQRSPSVVPVPPPSVIPVPPPSPGPVPLPNNRPEPPVGNNYPPPAGYRALRSVPTPVGVKAQEILRRPEPIGTQYLITVNGREYLFIKEWHKHAKGAPGDPLLNWHRGVTVYERVGGTAPSSPVPPSPPSAYQPSPTRVRFEQAVVRDDWREAFLNLNGLNMYEMLRALDGLPDERRGALMRQKNNFRGMVNMPRIEYAAQVVENRVLPSVAPGDLQATGQVGDAANFLAEKFSPVARAVNPGALANISLILLECNRQGIHDKSHIAYVLATAHHESGMGRAMVEFADGRAYEGRTGLCNTQPGDGPKFKGRGFVQITGRCNYTKYTNIISSMRGPGVDLVNNPQRAAEPAIAALILAHGMTNGVFTGRRLSEFGIDGSFNFVQARKIVNGLDRADLIAAHARRYRAVIR